MTSSYVDRWQRDLGEDRRIFEELHRQAERVTAERDVKLAELKRVLRRKVEAAPADKDGRANRRALVFTTFADTARYLYDHLERTGRARSWGFTSRWSPAAMETGARRARRASSSILAQFAPIAQQRNGVGAEIDILIATDCLSEGQNLQDCDLVVNYDIHWNPVRLMQRFGRIDRLGSRNRQVAMVNFWPTKDLDRYLDLKNRVEARMALANAAATGLDDPLDRGAEAVEDNEETAQGELAFRDEQLKRLREEILDIEDADDGVSMSDLTLDEFVADLLHYVQQNRAELEAAPFGIYAIADIDAAASSTGPSRKRSLIRPTGKSDPPRRDLLPEAADRSGRAHAQPPAALLPRPRPGRRNRALHVPAGQTEPRVVPGPRRRTAGCQDGPGERIRCGKRDTANRWRSTTSSSMPPCETSPVRSGPRSCDSSLNRAAQSLRENRSGPAPLEEFELITWFVIVEKKRAAGNGPNSDS